MTQTTTSTLLTSLQRRTGRSSLSLDDALRAAEQLLHGTTLDVIRHALSGVPVDTLAPRLGVSAAQVQAAMDAGTSSLAGALTSAPGDVLQRALGHTMAPEDYADLASALLTREGNVLRDRLLGRSTDELAAEHGVDTATIARWTDAATTALIDVLGSGATTPPTGTLPAPTPIPGAAEPGRRPGAASTRPPRTQRLRAEDKRSIYLPGLDTADIAELVARSTLGERERVIIRRRYIEADDSSTVLGDALGVSRARIIQLERAALEDLRDLHARSTGAATPTSGDPAAASPGDPPATASPGDDRAAAPDPAAARQTPITPGSAARPTGLQSIDPLALGTLLRELRTLAGHAPAHAAQLIGVGPGELEAWEAGTLTPRVLELALVSELYAVPLRTLLDIVIFEVLA